jgi:hypothetical protein
VSLAAWVVLGIVVWCALSVLLGVLFGKIIRNRDLQTGHDVTADQPDPEPPTSDISRTTPPAK